MATFSQRKGLTKVRDSLQVESMDDGLRNRLWDAVYFYHFHPDQIDDNGDNVIDSALIGIAWREVLNKPLSDLHSESLAVLFLKSHFFRSKWFEVYDFIEFISQNGDEIAIQGITFVESCNQVLADQLSAYRLVAGTIAQLTSDEEIEEIQNAIDLGGSLNPVSDHLQTALHHLANKTKPDYRNSIKESISAVESLCSRLLGRKCTLSDALKQIDDKVSIHPALKNGFNQIYGYTSDDSGIRHGMKESSTADIEDATFMLVACSAFINYLRTKAEKAGIELAP